MNADTDRNDDAGDLERFATDRSRELDRRAMGEFATPGLLLMEHASIGLALAATEFLDPDRPGPPTVEVICGPGNNGGDGLACARHLANIGIAVRIWELVAPGGRREGTDPAVQLAMVRARGLPLIDASSSLPEPTDPPADLRIDAIFGTGLSRPPAGIHREAIERLVADPIPVLAVDVPSGLDADLGVPREVAVQARMTVTLGIPKRGFLVPGAERFTGELRCVPIGVPRELLPEGFPAFPPIPHRLRASGDRFEF